MLLDGAPSWRQRRWQQVENKANCAVWIAYPQANDTVTWSGACVNGKAQGRGTQVWRGKWEENKYEGEMKDGKEQGRGIYVWADGARYEGEIKDDRLHGRGVAVWASGDRYEGDWKDGKEHLPGSSQFALTLPLISLARLVRP